MNQSMYHNIELRKLPAGKLFTIFDILEDNYAWTYMISHIPKHPTEDPFERKYNEEHVRLIINHAKESGRKCTEILFDEWGTSGRVRPTLNTLKDVLVKAQIFRAADIVAKMLNEEPPERPLDGPAAPIDINISLLLKSLGVDDNDNFDNHDEICADTTAQMNGNNLADTILSSEIPRIVLESTAEVGNENEHSNQSLNIPMLDILLPSGNIVNNQNYFEMPMQSTQSVQPDTSQNLLYDVAKFSQNEGGESNPSIENMYLIHFNYNQLEGMTNGFTDKIGSGGFGEVFKGHHITLGTLAVKKAHSSLLNTHKDVSIKLFDTEVKILSQFRHKNIVPIFGISTDGSSKCIVCEYIDGGSLEDKLKEKFLDSDQRLNIMCGTADGIAYLHSGGGVKQVRNTDSTSTTSEKFIHGDLKSANILLTKDYIPKICDFGLAKEFRNTYLQVSSIIGTHAYMAPEWYSGTITQKVDIYSYGVVLLELLTGLSAIINVNGEEINIIHYVKENGSNNITSMLDMPIRKWKKASKIYTLAKSCFRYERKDRPTAEKICETLHKLAKQNK